MKINLGFMFSNDKRVLMEVLSKNSFCIAVERTASLLVDGFVLEECKL